MKTSVINEKDNPLLKRKELHIDIDHDGSATPAKAELQQLLSKEFKKDVESVDIKNIFSDAGSSSSKATVFIWEEKKVEDLSKVVKKEPEQAAAPEAPAEAKEEKKEEPAPKEEKPKEEEAK